MAVPHCWLRRRLQGMRMLPPPAAAAAAPLPSTEAPRLVSPWECYHALPAPATGGLVGYIAKTGPERRVAFVVATGCCAATELLAQAGELFDYIVEKGRLLEDEARHFFQQARAKTTVGLLCLLPGHMCCPAAAAAATAAAAAVVVSAHQVDACH